MKLFLNKLKCIESINVSIVILTPNFQNSNPIILPTKVLCTVKYNGITINYEKKERNKKEENMKYLLIELV